MTETLARIREWLDGPGSWRVFATTVAVVVLVFFAIPALFLLGAQ